MRKLSTMTGKTLAAGLLAMTVSMTLQASDLAPRFTDADGDMVADAPTDPAQWVDPNTLVFAYTPVEDPAVYAQVWDGFLKHMEAVTGKRVQFFPVHFPGSVQRCTAGSHACGSSACGWL